MRNSTGTNIDKPVDKNFIHLSLVSFITIDVAAIVMNIIFLRVIHGGDLL